MLCIRNFQPSKAWGSTINAAGSISDLKSKGIAEQYPSWDDNEWKDVLTLHGRSVFFILQNVNISMMKIGSENDKIAAMQGKYLLGR